MSSQSSNRTTPSRLSSSSSGLSHRTTTSLVPAPPTPPIYYNKLNTPNPSPCGHHNHHFTASIVGHEVHKYYHETLRMIRDVSYRPLVKINPSYDLVVITGGSHGLGHEIALNLSKIHKFQVIVLDITPPDKGTKIHGVTYFVCDVSNINELTEISHKIRNNFGTVTVLINNAGVMKGEKPIIDLNYNEIKSTLDVNLLSSFLTIKTFLPDMIKRHRGSIVTISSALGYASPAKLSVYGASKAGLIGLHESLTRELGPPAFPETGVRTLLVCPGQIRTPLFVNVKSPYPLIAPVLEPNYAAKSITNALLNGYYGELKLPLYVYGMPFLRTFPHQLATLSRTIIKIDTSA